MQHSDFTYKTIKSVFFVHAFFPSADKVRPLLSAVSSLVPKAMVERRRYRRALWGGKKKQSFEIRVKRREKRGGCINLLHSEGRRGLAEREKGRGERGVV